MKECGEDPKGFYDEMVKGEVTEQIVRALVDPRQNQGRYVSRSVRSPWLLAPKSKAARVQPYKECFVLKKTENGAGCLVYTVLYWRSEDAVS